MSLEAVETGRRGRRRRRRRKGRERGARVRTFGSVLPSLLTTGNLAAGFYAIVKSGTGDPVTASYAIFVAGVFDILDGRAARMTGSESRFGAEYDSIADTVSRVPPVGLPYRPLSNRARINAWFATVAGSSTWRAISSSRSMDWA